MTLSPQYFVIIIVRSHRYSFGIRYAYTTNKRDNVIQYQLFLFRNNLEYLHDLVFGLADYEFERNTEREREKKNENGVYIWKILKRATNIRLAIRHLNRVSIVRKWEYGAKSKTFSRAPQWQHIICISLGNVLLYALLFNVVVVVIHMPQ